MLRFVRLSVRQSGNRVRPGFCQEEHQPPHGALLLSRIRTNLGLSSLSEWFKGQRALVFKPGFCTGVLFFESHFKAIVNFSGDVSCFPFSEGIVVL